MTPFDPWALLAMLLAFYPTVSAAAFAQARRERPEYFAGGRIVGSGGDKLQLPDGRIFDYILAVDGPAAGRRWIMLDVTNDPGAPASPFALEPGPLVPLDEEFTLPPGAGPMFENLVAGELEAFGASDGQLHTASVAIVEFSGAALLEDAYEREIVPALDAHSAFASSLDADDVGTELEAAEDHGRIIDGTETEYDEDPPDDLPEPDPGRAPDEGPEKPPKEF